MEYPKNVTREIAFRKDNTVGYLQVELDLLNDELSFELKGIEMFSDDWYQEAKRFSDEVSRR